MTYSIVAVDEKTGECGSAVASRSIAVIVVPGPEIELDINLGLRVDNHERPLEELQRLQRACRREFPAQAATTC